MKARLSTTLVFASMMLTLAETQARTIYWTGYGETEQQAINNGDSGVRRDCVVNKGVQHSVCYNAPITQIDDMGVVLARYDGWGNPIYQYVRRVYIYLP